MSRLSMTVRAGVLALGLMLLVPAGVLASPGTAVNLDCSLHAKLTRHYTAGQLRDALRTMPTDEAEYSDCHDVIERQLLAQIGGAGPTNGPGAGGSGGSFLPAWLIVVLVVVALGAAASAAVAVRNRRRPPLGE